MASAGDVAEALYRIGVLERGIERLQHSGAGADHERRVVEIERELQEFSPAVVQEQIRVIRQQIEGLRADFKNMQRSFYTFAFGVVGAAVTFAFAVFALLGK